MRDRGFLYPVMEAGAGEMTLTLGQQWAGADLLYDPLGDRYIIEKIIQLQAAVAGSNRAAASRPGTGATTPGPSSRSFCK